MMLRDILIRIIGRLNIDSKARLHILTHGGSRTFVNRIMKIDAYTWENAAGNHAFDDYPEVYGITKKEGHVVRASFQRDASEVQVLLSELGAFRMVKNSNDERGGDDPRTK